MSEIRPKKDYWVRGISKEGKTVYGNYVQLLVDSEEKAYIYPFPKHANSSNHSYSPQPVECEYESIKRFTGVYDCEGEAIYEGDIVKILPAEASGTVCFELGTWGIGTTKTIDWDKMEDAFEPWRGSSHFLFNDNFVSFYELFDNYCSEDAPDASCNVVKILRVRDEDN